MRRILAGPLLVAVALVAGCSNPEAAKLRAFENGNRYFEQKKYAEAIIEYRNAIQVDPKFVDARSKLADAYAATGNDRAAFNEQVRVADLRPEDDEAQLKAATYMLLARRFEDVKSRVQRVLAHDPRNVQALVLLGNAFAGLKDLDGAIAEIEQAIEIDPSRSGAYTNLAALKVRAGDRDQARAAFEKAVEIDPKSIDSLVALATFQWGTGDGPSAEQSLKKALALDPKHVQTNRVLAAYYLGSDRPIEAEPFLKIVAAAAGPGAKIALADYYISLRRLDEAHRVLDAMLAAKDVEGVSAQPVELRLAQVAYAENRVADAHKMLETLLTADSRNTSALQLQARWLFGEGKTKEALASATAAVAADPNSPPALYLLGTIQMAMLDLGGAAKSFTDVLKLNPRAAEAQVQLSKLTLVRGDSAGAVQFAQTAVHYAPRNVIARLSLVRGLIAQGQIATARDEMSSLLKEFPDSAPVHSMNGLLKARSKDVPGAKAEYQRALQLDPSSIDALTGLALIEAMAKNTGGARSLVEARLVAEPDRPELIALAARVNLADQNTARAEQLLRRLIEIDPSNPLGYSLLGQMYLIQGNLDAAMAEFERRVRLNPKDIGAHTMIAMILEAERKLPEAKKKYEEVLALDRNSAIVANNLAYLYAQSGENLDRALTLAQGAADQAPANPLLQDTLGWVYYTKNQMDLAVGALQQSIALDPTIPLSHYHLGMVYLKSGDPARARRSLETALKLKRDYTDAERALKSITG